MGLGVPRYMAGMAWRFCVGLCLLSVVVVCPSSRGGASSLSAWGTSVGFDGIADVDGVCVHKGYVVVACRVLHSVRYLM